MNQWHNRTAAAVLALTTLSTGTMLMFSEQALAQQPSAESTSNALLSLAEIERRVTAEGLQITDVELGDRVAEVEGRDSSGREVEWIVDRRDGSVLSREIDD